MATIPSKRLRNKIAGFTTHLMKRIQKGLMASSFRIFSEKVCFSGIVKVIFMWCEWDVFRDVSCHFSESLCCDFMAANDFYSRFVFKPQTRTEFSWSSQVMKGVQTKGLKAHLIWHWRLLSLWCKSGKGPFVFFREEMICWFSGEFHNRLDPIISKLSFGDHLIYGWFNVAVVGWKPYKSPPVVSGWLLGTFSPCPSVREPVIV